MTKTQAIRAMRAVTLSFDDLAAHIQGGKQDLGSDSRPDTDEKMLHDWPTVGSAPDPRRWPE
jgi:hypothetical protein